MSSLTWRILSTSSDNTMQLAELLGARCRGGEVIELISDVGGGKTTFVRGLARGMGSTDSVASPSFTLSREYRSDRLTMYHFDFYRLSDPGIVANELAEVVGDNQAVVVVEWADIVENVLPTDKLTIKISNKGENKRELVCEYPQKLAYMIVENA